MRKNIRNQKSSRKTKKEFQIISNEMKRKNIKRKNRKKK